MDGYLNVDIRESCNPDIVCDVERLPFKEGSVDEIQAIDVFEHISFRKSKEVLKHWIGLLKSDGVIYIQSPSITRIMEYLIQAKSLFELETVISLLYGNQDYEQNYHKTVCDPHLLAHYLREIGVTGEISYSMVNTNMILKAYKS